MVRADLQKKRSRTQLQKLSGKWKIIEMPDFDDDYLSESDPHFELNFRGKLVDGHFQYGLCNGDLDGEVITSEGRPVEIRFSFEGLDEGDSWPRSENGYGEAVLSDDNKTLTGKLHIHLGDTWRSTCRRS